MFGPFKPAPHIAELPAEKIDSTYKRLRWQVFAGIFFGYAAYYFVRANFDLAQPGLIQAGLYSKAELGVIGSAAGLAYGLSKFVMAGMSDRSNPPTARRANCAPASPRAKAAAASRSSPFGRPLLSPPMYLKIE